MKSLDSKLANIRSGAYTPRDFIIADAKDADMASGLMAPGPARDKSGSPTGTKPAPRAAYFHAMREMVRSELVDIMLTSASTSEILVAEGLFKDSPVTPAVRLNDTSDIWFQRGSRYLGEASRPFRTARLEKVRTFTDLGLYSVTFSNDVVRDIATLEAYSAFRSEACALGMRYFLEVFNPLIDAGVTPDDLGYFIADSITRTLAGVVSLEQPLFLKIVYNGRRAMEQLTRYDPSRLIVGVLGGSKGTTRDTFELLFRAEQAGARVALFGRKINLSEDPLTLVGLMRRLIQGEMTPIEAVQMYHEVLRSKGITPLRALEDDCEISDLVLRNE